MKIAFCVDSPIHSQISEEAVLAVKKAVNFLEKEGIQEFDTTFLSDVSTTLFVEESEIERLGQELTEFYQGKVNYKKSGKKIVEIPI